MFFNDWQAIFRVVVMSSTAYVALVFLLRTSGKRTLSKFNMFDFVITIALGSIFATIVLSKDIALAEGVTAIAMLIGLQFIVARLSVTWRWFREVVKGEPTLLLYKGNYLWDAMKKERVTGEDVRSALREQGISRVDKAAAVVLETDGTLTVVPELGTAEPTTLEDIDLPTEQDIGTAAYV